MYWEWTIHIARIGTTFSGRLDKASFTLAWIEESLLFSVNNMVRVEDPCLSYYSAIISYTLVCCRWHRCSARILSVFNNNISVPVVSLQNWNLIDKLMQWLGQHVWTAVVEYNKNWRLAIMYTAHCINIIFCCVFFEEAHHQHTPFDSVFAESLTSICREENLHTRTYTSIEVIRHNYCYMLALLQTSSTRHCFSGWIEYCRLCPVPNYCNQQCINILLYCQYSVATVLHW